MRLPNADVATVPWAKVVSYLLSPAHPDGRHKARFFLRFGFSQDAYDVFAAALVEHAKTNEVAGASDTPFGVTYTVEGPIETPDGRSPAVRTVWGILRDETVPRFVTAYPLERRHAL